MINQLINQQYHTWYVEQRVASLSVRSCKIFFIQIFHEKTRFFLPRANVTVNYCLGIPEAALTRRDGVSSSFKINIFQKIIHKFSTNWCDSWNSWTLREISNELCFSFDWSRFALLGCIIRKMHFFLQPEKLRRSIDVYMYTDVYKYMKCAMLI